MIHLLNLRTTGSVCGASADMEAGTLTAEINEVTCLECFTRHEAYCEARDEDSRYFGQSEEAIMADPEFLAECAQRVRKCVA